MTVTNSPRTPGEARPGWGRGLPVLAPPPLERHSLFRRVWDWNHLHRHSGLVLHVHVCGLCVCVYCVCVYCVCVFAYCVNTVCVCVCTVCVCVCTVCVCTVCVCICVLCEYCVCVLCVCVCTVRVLCVYCVCVCVHRNHYNQGVDGSDVCCWSQSCVS
jgi:GINS complex subunit 2